MMVQHIQIRDVEIPPLGLPGRLAIPPGAGSIVIFAHGSGSSRFSPRNNAVARALNETGMATLLFDLLAPEEEADRRNVFDIPLLAGRLIDAVRWTEAEQDIVDRPLGLFGASTGAAAALVAAAELGPRVGAIVSRGGRPDLADAALEEVRAPTLLIVGGNDEGVIELNEAALKRLTGPKSLKLIPGATHLFSEPGALQAVTAEAIRWFGLHLGHASRETDEVPHALHKSR